MRYQMPDTTLNTVHYMMAIIINIIIKDMTMISHPLRLESKEKIN